MDYVWIALGAIAGANIRYVIGGWAGNRFGASFPFGTFAINITGALLIGFLLTLLTEVLITDPRWRLLSVIGFLGSYTTFSTYTFEALGLTERAAWGRAAIYIVGSNAAGLVACIAGVAVARAVNAR